jgi:hypothetical protein
MTFRVSQERARSELANLVRLRRIRFRFALYVPTEKTHARVSPGRGETPILFTTSLRSPSSNSYPTCGGSPSTCGGCTRRATRGTGGNWGPRPSARKLTTVASRMPAA